MNSVNLRFVKSIFIFFIEENKNTYIQYICDLWQSCVPGLKIKEVNPTRISHKMAVSVPLSLLAGKKSAFNFKIKINKKKYRYLPSLQKKRFYSR